ncbi:MAG: hypothetical protein HDR82_09590 [Bacteroides sp.]|nr:hypothetical protein [Bacteroides sp.]
MLLLGTLNWITAYLSPKWWLAAISIAASLYSFYIAWRLYRRARRLAGLIDQYLQSINRQLGNHLTLLKIIINGKES